MRVNRVRIRLKTGPNRPFQTVLFLCSVIVAYLVLTCLYCYPVFTSKQKIVLGFWDNYYAAWDMWVFARNTVDFPGLPWVTDLVYHPTAYVTVIYQAIPNNLMAVGLLQWLSLPTTYNLIVMILFFSSALAMFVLLLNLLEDRCAAFFGGCLYGFSSFMQVAMCYGHTNRMQLQYFPLFILSVVLLKKKITPWRNLFFFVSFVLLAVSCAYNFIYLLGSFIACMIIYDLATRRFNREFFANFIVLSFLSCIVVFLFYYPNQAGKFNSPEVTYLKNNIGAYSTYSNDLINFVVPPPQHPLWKRVTTFLDGKVNHGDTQFFGYGTILLSLYALLFVKWKEKKFWLFYFIVVSVFSLGPILRICGATKFGGVPIPLPYYVMTKLPIVWGLRIPSRFNVGILCSYCILAGVAIKHIRGRISPKAFYPLFAIVVLIVLYENIYLDHGIRNQSNFYKCQYLPGTVPDFYRDLATRDDVDVLLELPSGAEQLCEIYDFRYMFYQTIHEKKLMSGKLPRYLPEYEKTRATDPILKYLYNPRLIKDVDSNGRKKISNSIESTLRHYGVDYLILHEHLGWVISAELYNDLKNLIDYAFGDRVQIIGDLRVVKVNP